MHPIALGALFALQCFHVLFLALHDWIPLGTFNDVKAVRDANPGRKLVAATLISLIPFAIGLGASAVYFGRARGALSGDVRRDARFPARTQQHPAEYAACM